MSKDRCQNDYNKDLCRYITFWYCQTRHIIVSLFRNYNIMMGIRTTALQYAFRASLPIMAGYRHGSCWRSSHYAYTFRPFRGIRLRTVHSLAWGDVAQVIAVVFTILVHVWRRNLMWSIVAGTVCYMALIRVPGL